MESHQRCVDAKVIDDREHPGQGGKKRQRPVFARRQEGT